MNSSDGWTLSSTPRPISPNTTTTSAQPTSTGTAYRTAKRAIGVIKCDAPAGSRSVPGPRPPRPWRWCRSKRRGARERIPLPRQAATSVGSRATDRSHAALSLPHETIVDPARRGRLPRAALGDEVDALAAQGGHRPAGTPGRRSSRRATAATRCYVIDSGRVKVMRRLADGQPITLAQIGARRRRR